MNLEQLHSHGGFQMKLVESRNCPPPPEKYQSGPTNCLITLPVSDTGTGTWTGTDTMQNTFTLAVSGTKIGHLKAIEISLKHNA